jgi:hypothetical protein
VASKKQQEPEAALKRVTIRMPADLHSALLQRREETGHSLNDLLIEAAAKLLGLPVPELPKAIPGRKPQKGGKEQLKGKRSAPG